MPCIPLSFFQARSWTVWGNLCSIWLDCGHAPTQQAMLVSLGSCHMRKRLHRVLTYALPPGATFHFNNTLDPELQYRGMKHCHTCACTYVSFRTLTAQCYVLRAYPFNLKATRWKCATFLDRRTLVPNAVTEIPFQRPAVRDLLQNVFGRRFGIVDVRLSSLPSETVTLHCSKGGLVSAAAIN